MSITSPTSALSKDANIPAVKGESPPGGAGVLGVSALGHGVHGESTSSRGVVGLSKSFHGVYGHSDSNVGVAGESQTSDGVWGVSHDPAKSGVYGLNQAGGRGVAGFSNTFQGVYGHSDANAGVVGESGSFDGIWGVAHNASKSGVYGLNRSGGRGVMGVSDAFDGVYGISDSHVGVVGESKAFDGVWGIANVKERAGIVGKNNQAGGLAGYFDGNVIVTGDLTLPNADFAEDFDIAGGAAVEPGTVMVLGGTGGPGVQPIALRQAGRRRRLRRWPIQAGDRDGQAALGRQPSADRARRQGLLQGGCTVRRDRHG